MPRTSYRLHLLPRAARNLRDIVWHIAAQDAWAAERVADAIIGEVRRLVDHPRSGRMGREPGTRELVIARYPYVVIYRLTGHTIDILQVLHQAQKWP